ncbi:hypothetical protein FOZ63_001315 [Perkinsus olseni]|uniref:STAS domain-containing protein n=1 Tax=Perkinsus olseni TaxID=32597 RepID=A0A7J6RS52_PEROL|nr:hypothetical protein FOZ63_001315 [Perkinsus olseni]
MSLRREGPREPGTPQQNLLYRSLVTPLLRRATPELLDAAPKEPITTRLAAAVFNSLPITMVLQAYTGSVAKRDIRGGVVLGLVAISQSMAHANIAHVTLIHGPYSCVWPPLIYALFGSSRHLSVGTGAMMALMTGEQVVNYPDIETRTRVACQLALITGVALWVMAALRMSFLVRFISRPALSGFVTGSAFVILATQMKDFFGLRSVPKGVDFFENVYFITTCLPQTCLPVLLLGLLVVVVIEGSKRFKAIPYLRRVSQFKELIAVIIATILCWLISSLYTDEVEDFIPHVGEVPSGLPSFSLPSSEGITEVIPNGFMVSLMCFISSYAPAKKFAIVDRYDINAGSELTALGAANIIAKVRFSKSSGSLFGAMPVQGGMSRTSLGYASGVKSQVAGLVAAVVAVGVLALLTPLMGIILMYPFAMMDPAVLQPSPSTSCNNPANRSPLMVSTVRDRPKKLLSVVRATLTRARDEPRERPVSIGVIDTKLDTEYKQWGKSIYNAFLEENSVMLLPLNPSMTRTHSAYRIAATSMTPSANSRFALCGRDSAQFTPTCYVVRWVYWVPRCALAGIIITAATHLMDFHHARWLVAHSKKDAAVWLMAFVGTLVFGLLQGVFLSVMLSVTLMIYSIALPPSFAMGSTSAGINFSAGDRHNTFDDDAQPHSACVTLAQLFGGPLALDFNFSSNFWLSNGQWRAIKYWPQSAKTIPGILVFGVNGPLIFANWEYVKDKLLKTEEKYSAYCSKPVEAVVIQLGGVPIVDATAVQGLEELAEEYSARGVTLWFAGAQGSVRKIIDQVLVRRRKIDQTGGDGDFVGVGRILADLVQHVEAVVKQILPGIDLPVKTQAAVIIQRWWRSQSEKVKEMDGEIQDTYVNSHFAVLRDLAIPQRQVQWAVDESTVADMIRCESLQCISLDQHYAEPLTMGQYEHCLRRRQMGSITTTADLVRRNTAAQLQHLLDPTPPEDN